MIELARPGLLWVLLLLVPLARLRWQRMRAIAVAWGPLQYQRPGISSRSLPGLLLLLELLVAVAMIVVLSGPRQVDEVQSLREEGLDIALVVDVSVSMQADDFPPNRLEASKKLSADLISRSASDRIALIAFAGHAFTQTPPTSDHRILLPLLESLAYESVSHGESGGTAIGDALLVAMNSLDGVRLDGRDQVIILLTDGESNLGLDPLLAARMVAEKQIDLHVIGVGGEEPVPVFVHGKPFINSDDEHLVTSLDETQLRQVAEFAGGDYYRALSVDALQEILEDLAGSNRGPLEARVMRLTDSLAPELSLILLFPLFLGWLLLQGVVTRPLP